MNHRSARNWNDLYLSAVFELDCDELVGKVVAAESAIRDRSAILRHRPIRTINKEWLDLKRAQMTLNEIHAIIAKNKHCA